MNAIMAEGLDLYVWQKFLCFKEFNSWVHIGLVLLKPMTYLKVSSKSHLCK